MPHQELARPRRQELPETGLEGLGERERGWGDEEKLEHGCVGEDGGQGGCGRDGDWDGGRCRCVGGLGGRVRRGGRGGCEWGS